MVSLDALAKVNKADCGWPTAVAAEMCDADKAPFVLFQELL